MGTKQAERVQSSVKFGTLNCNSILNKTVGVLEHLLETGCDVCFVQETFLRVNDDAKLAEIRDYGMNVISNPRKHRSGGGIAFLYKSDFKLKINTQVTKYKSFQVMEAVLKTEDELLRLVNIYRPPYSKKARFTECDFLSEFEDYLKDLTMKQGTPIIAGDFNFHVERPNDHYPKKLLHLLADYSLIQHVPAVPTHDQGGTLDLFITRKDFSTRMTEVDIRQSGTNSDHFLVLINAKLKVIPSKTESHFTSYRNFNHLNIDDFKSDIKKSDLNDFDKSQPLDDIVRLYNNSLTQLMDNHCPVIKKKIKEKDSPWIDEELRDLRRKRRKAEEKKIKEKTEENKANYKRLKHEFNKMAAIKRCLYNRKSLKNSSGDIKTLYKKLNRLLGNATSDLPQHQDEAKLAENFKNFFGEKITEIRDNIKEEVMERRAKDTTEDAKDTPEEAKDPPEDPRHRRDANARPYNEFTQFEPITSEELYKLVSKMSNKFCTLDPIPTFVLKKCIKELMPILLHIINQSLTSGVFPDEMKKAVIKPTIKKAGADPDVMKNFRPVSNLSAISKLVERVALNQWNAHLTLNDLYCPVQSGYRPLHSCETLLLKMFDDISKKIQKDQTVVLILLDLSAAFDTIDHTILAKKLLDDYGISGTALQWLQSYLTNRTYCVKIGDTMSSVMELLFGVPQGSLLGPILFILYTKFLQNIAKRYGLDIQLYADDSQLYIGFSASRPSEFADIKERIRQCLEEIKTWMLENFMKLNQAKTELLVFGRSSNLNKSRGLDVSISFGDTVIVQTMFTGDNGKSLGVMLDETLSMDRQIASVKKKCSWTMMNLRTIGSYLDEEVKLMMVKQLVISKLDYCNVLYMNLAKKRLKKLTSILNQGIRFIYNIKDRSEDLIPYYKKAHILPIEQRIVYKVCLLTHKAVHGTSPAYIRDLVTIDTPTDLTTLTRSKMVGDLGTVDAYKLKTPKMTKTKFEDRCFSNYAPAAWNVLPLGLRSLVATTEFKSKLKTHFYGMI